MSNIDGVINKQCNICHVSHSWEASYNINIIIRSISINRWILLTIQGGCPTFKSFNLYTASSTTSTGQLLISTAQACFEYFLSNNNPFRSYSECQQYIENITTEKFNLSNKIIPNISINRCFERLKSMFDECV